MSDYEEKCPSCGTEAIYKIADNDFGCKCTYELETDIELGKKLERDRIIKILESLAQHDEEMCYFDGKLICYPEDCNAGVFAWTLQLIQNERTNYKQT